MSTLMHCLLHCQFNIACLNEIFPVSKSLILPTLFPEKEISEFELDA
jgi:hypothetical protein